MREVKKWSWFPKCVHRVTPLGWGSQNTPGLGKLCSLFIVKFNRSIKTSFGFINRVDEVIWLSQTGTFER